MLEADVKKAVSDYLQIGMNQGHWLFMRLNAGSFIVQNSDGSYRRRVQGVEKGTADFVVIQPMFSSPYHDGQPFGLYKARTGCRVTFLEIKSSKGKTTKEQDEFAEKVKQYHCNYFIVRDADTLVDILK